MRFSIQQVHENKKTAPPWVAVENLLAGLFIRYTTGNCMGRNPQKVFPLDKQKGGSTQSRPNLTNHHYKEPW